MLRFLPRRVLGLPVRVPAAFGSGRCAAVQPPQPPDTVADIVASLEKDPELVKAVVNAMSPETRRRLVVTGGAYEWFGRDRVASEVQSADVDQDRTICPKDFDKWFEDALRRKVQEQSKDAPQPQEAADAAEASTSQKVVRTIPLAALALVALEAGLPFVGFGFLDNATMILAGDAIDRSLGFYLNCSVMASAAMGNIVSGCMGMQVHGFVEKLVQRLKLPIPNLTAEERRSQRVFLAGHIGGTVGIAAGLSMGLLPLMFIRDSDDKAEHKAFHSLDVNHDGTVSAPELQGALLDLGLALPEETASQIIHAFGTDGRMNFEQFKAMCESIKKGHTIKATAPAPAPA